MRIIDTQKIVQAVKEACIKANQNLPPDVLDKLKAAQKEEPWAPAKQVLTKLEENIQSANHKQIPICQDTGMACVFVELGQEVHLEGQLLDDAINEGVRQGYQEGYLRKSVVQDPFQRVNTKDNTPALITVHIVAGNEVKITVAPKGFGSENMSRVAMLKPADGKQGVEKFIVETVKLAGANPCPPIIIGVGIGGSFDKAALLAKQALLRPLTKANKNPFYAQMETDLLNKINQLGIGPAGYGGQTTALGVSIETMPTHIAGLPVAINVSCHATRRATAIL